jgi:cell division protein FtsW
VSLLLTILTLIPGVTPPIMGARRWLVVFGVSVQPSELVKLALVLYLSSVLAKKVARMGDFVSTIVPPLIVVLLFTGLIYLQNDFSTALLVFLLSLSVLFVAHVPLHYFLPLAMVGLPLGVVLLFSKEHRIERVASFLDPLADPSGTGFQVIAARSALVDGGFWGRGLGRGIRKLGGLPEAYSDFIFAVVGEEIGFVGVFLVIVLFCVFTWRGYAIAMRHDEPFHRYLSFGLTTAVALQALTNMLVVAGLIPATGIPLPFFSSGGSSLVVTLTMCGLLLNLSRVREEYGGGHV